MTNRARDAVARRRPALAAALAFAVGVWVGECGAPWEWSAGLGLSILACSLLVRIDRVSLAVLLSFAGLGAFRCRVRDFVVPPGDLRRHSDSGGQVIFYGRTVGEPEIRPDATRLILEADSVAYPDSICPRTGRALARFKFNPGIGPDCRVKIAGRLRPPPVARSPGGFSWADYLRRRGMEALLDPAPGSPVLQVEPTGSWWLSAVVAPLRRQLKRELVAHLEGEEAALLAGLLLGEREQLSPATVNAFTRTGTLHLLAVSGSNVGVVICVTWGVLLFLRIPRPARILLAGLLVVLFCFLAHSEASVMRASMAGLLALGALALRRRADALNLWGCALLLLLAWEPAWLFDVGFQLSFGATLGILLAAPLIPSGGRGGRLHRLVGPLLGSLVVSMSAQLGTLPTLAAAFNEVPLVTPLSNLACVPLAGVATSAGVLSLLLSPLGDAVLAVTSAATWLGLRLLLLAVHAFDGLQVPTVGLPTPGVLDVLCFAGTGLTLMAFVRCPAFRRRAIFCEAVVLCFGLGFRYGSAPAGPEAVVLDGPDLVALARLPSGEVWAVTGNPDYPTARAVQVALKLGWRAPRHRIDLEAENERSTSTLRTASCCDSMAAAEPTRGSSALTVWCRRSDSRPVAVVVADPVAALVICRDPFAHRPAELAPYRRVLWVSDNPALLALGSGEGSDRSLLAGRSPAPLSTDTAQMLSTRSSGSIRILWRDGVFQTEPSIR